jgi:hypothetical protein
LVLRADPYEGRASAEQLRLLTEILFAAIDAASAHAVAAYTEQAAQSESAVQAARGRLLDALLSPDGGQPIEELAHAAQWQLPAAVACVVLDEAWNTDERLPPALPPDVLVDLGSPDPCLLVPDPDGPGRWDMLRSGLRGVRFVVGASVPLPEALVSLRMARHALSLMRRGLWPESDHVRCAEHLPTLLLLNDEGMALQLVRRHMGAFDVLKPHQRDRMIETLREWLVNGGSTQDVGTAFGPPADRPLPSAQSRRAVRRAPAGPGLAVRNADCHPRRPADRSESGRACWCK